MSNFKLEVPRQKMNDYWGLVVQFICWQSILSTFLSLSKARKSMCKLACVFYVNYIFWLLTLAKFWFCFIVITINMLYLCNFFRIVRCFAKIFPFRVVSGTISVAWRFTIYCSIWWPEKHYCYCWHGWKVNFLLKIV